MFTHRYLFLLWRRCNTVSSWCCPYCWFWEASTTPPVSQLEVLLLRFFFSSGRGFASGPHLEPRCWLCPELLIYLFLAQKSSTFWLVRRCIRSRECCSTPVFNSWLLILASYTRRLGTRSLSRLYCEMRSACKRRHWRSLAFFIRNSWVWIDFRVCCTYRNPR